VVGSGVASLEGASGVFSFDCSLEGSPLPGFGVAVGEGLGSAELVALVLRWTQE
jgi:hypothetical protein